MAKSQKTSNLKVAENSDKAAEVAVQPSSNVPEAAAKASAKPADAPAGDSRASAEPGNCQGTSAPDPFDPEQLRLSQDFAGTIGVKKELLTIPVRKPSKERWVRVHPDAAYRVQTYVVELKDDQEVYLVARELWAELAAESTFSARALFTAMDRQGVLFIWPIRLPGPDGRLDDWNESALEAAELASRRWVRVAANRDVGAYDVFTTESCIPEPEWPTVPFRDLLQVAFKGRYIDSMGHPVLKRLRGEG